MNLGLQSKIALVTAASQGLGKAAALALAREGATVAICSRRKHAIEATAKEIREESGVEVLPIVADVSKQKDLVRLISRVKKAFGSIHILVNNAGGPPTGNILTMPDDEWQKGIDLILMSIVRLTRAVLPMMVAQKWGRVITITSITAKEPINDLLISSTLRPGILGLTKVLSNQHAAKNITVNAICPGMIFTKRQEELMRTRLNARRISAARYMREAVENIPAGRFGMPEEIGAAIAFLSSEQAAYINGIGLLIDGGMAKGVQ